MPSPRVRLGVSCVIEPRTRRPGNAPLRRCKHTTVSALPDNKEHAYAQAVWLDSQRVLHKKHARDALNLASIHIQNLTLSRLFPMVYECGSARIILPWRSGGQLAWRRRPQPTAARADRFAPSSLVILWRGAGRWRGKSLTCPGTILAPQPRRPAPAADSVADSGMMRPSAQCGRACASPK